MRKECARTRSFCVIAVLVSREVCGGHAQNSRRAHIGSGESGPGDNAKTGAAELDDSDKEPGLGCVTVAFDVYTRGISRSGPSRRKLVGIQADYTYPDVTASFCLCGGGLT
jgi:hypothetical protein